MSVFQKYSDYYDILYQDKDYQGEVEYVEQLIRRHASGAKTILEFGCGSGRHAEIFAAKGYSVLGVDNSESMLKLAAKRINDSNQDKIELRIADIRDLRIDRKFDVVVSLFHVVNYQTTDEDLERTFAAAASHLKPDGLFIFDSWHGPAVLSDQPAIRVKEFEEENSRLTRISLPELNIKDNTVLVRFKLLIRDQTTKQCEEIIEEHKMRFLFQLETRRLFHENGLEPLVCEEWLTGAAPRLDSWSVCFVGRLKSHS